MDASLIEPKEIDIDGSIFIISKIPVITALELMYKIPTAAIPKVGDFLVLKEAFLKLISYSSIVTAGGSHQRLLNESLVNTQIKDVATIWVLAENMIEYNFRFFPPGSLSNFRSKIMMLPQLISKISTALPELLSQMEKQPSTN